MLSMYIYYLINQSTVVYGKNLYLQRLVEVVSNQTPYEEDVDLIQKFHSSQENC